MLGGRIGGRLNGAVGPRAGLRALAAGGSLRGGLDRRERGLGIDRACVVDVGLAVDRRRRRLSVGGGVELGRLERLASRWPPSSAGSATASATASASTGVGDGGRDAAAAAQVAEIVERRRLGQALGHRGEAGRILLGEQALEEGGHLGLEAGDAALDALDALLDERGVRLDLALERGLAVRRCCSSVSSRMRAISALDHSRMAATSSSAAVAELVGLVGRAAWIASMCALASAWKLREGLVARDSAAVCMAFVRSAMNLFGLRVGGGLDRGAGSPRGAADRSSGGWAASIGVSFTRAARCPRACGARRSPRDPSSASVSWLGDGLVGRGRRRLGRGVGRVGLVPLGAPREPEAGSGVGRGHASGSSVGSGRVGDVQGVAACCQPWLVWWSPLEVPAVGPGGTAAPLDARPVPEGTATNRGSGARMWHS